MSPRTLAVVLAAALALSACGGAPEPDTAATPTTDPELVSGVNAAFATYRAGIAQGDDAAVVQVIDQASREDMARIAELAQTADGPTTRGLPAAEQLLVLTYRLRPELLRADDPYAALVGAGLAGQDRSLGDLGDVTEAGDGLALGVVVDPATQTPTPLRWRFRREAGAWRFDLREAHRMISQAIANGADRAGTSVDQIVTATVVDLSGEDERTVAALYTETP